MWSRVWKIPNTDTCYDIQQSYKGRTVVVLWVGSPVWPHYCGTHTATTQLLENRIADQICDERILAILWQATACLGSHHCTMAPSTYTHNIERVGFNITFFFSPREQWKWLGSQRPHFSNLQCATFSCSVVRTAVPCHNLNFSRWKGALYVPFRRARNEILLL